LLDAAQRHGIPDSRGLLIGVKYTHQEIADYVGSTRETVTLTLGELKRRDLLLFDHRRIVVRDPDALSRAVQERS
jgi:CRP-like cAMP-binding protein